MRLTMKDKSGKCIGCWVARTKRGFNKKQRKEIKQAHFLLLKQQQTEQALKAVQVIASATKGETSMKLITKEVEAKLLKHPLYSQEKNKTPEVLVKFFTPWSNWTWYVTEGNKTETGDWEFFGLVEGQEKELGYFTLSELQSVRGPAGLKIERDMYFGNRKINTETNEVIK